MQNLPQCSNRQYEDIQIQYTDCCTSVIRKVQSSKQNIERYDSQKTLKHSREKGITITSKSATKLNYYFNTPLKLNIKSIEKSTDDIAFSKKKQGEDINISKGLSRNSGLTNSKKVLHIQRCIDYKNKKILQHNNQNDFQENASYKKQKDNQLQSTRKHTFRTSQESLIKISNIKNTESFNQRSEISIIKYKNKDQNFNRKLQIHVNYKKSQKTLSKLYEQSKGQKFLTVESVQSENGDLQSGKQSIIEPFSFSNNLIV